MSAALQRLVSTKDVSASIDAQKCSVVECRRYWLYLSATEGSNRAARSAGRKPKAIPIRVEQTRAISAIALLNSTGHPAPMGQRARRRTQL